MRNGPSVIDLDFSGYLLHIVTSASVLYAIQDSVPKQERFNNKVFSGYLESIRAWLGEHKHRRRVFKRSESPLYLIPYIPRHFRQFTHVFSVTTDALIMAIRNTLSMIDTPIEVLPVEYDNSENFILQIVYGDSKVLNPGFEPVVKIMSL